ncbi:MAG: HMP-PP phosphatase [Chlamydiae bacterium]|nr:HMP-PP phosphatase [Chlamydiota bacterium]
MTTLNGIIALDIDGTVTIQKHHLEARVADFLHELAENGWQLLFITGRTFSFAKPILSSLKGEFYLAVQNGATLFSMPSEKVLKKHTISAKSLPYLEQIFAKREGGFLVESGKERGDICYYKPADFAPKELEYLNFRIGLSPENWTPLDSFEEYPFPDFSVGKYFAPEKEAYQIAEEIQQIPGFGFSVVVIRDPFNPGEYLAHVNELKGTKEGALAEFIPLFPEGLPVIVAGDDYNDEKMLAEGDIAIVMEDAPDALKSIAHIIAPPAKEEGIIPALREAIQRVV